MNRMVNRAAVVFSVMLLFSACDGKADSPVAGPDPVPHHNMEWDSDAATTGSTEAANEPVGGMMKRIDIMSGKGAKIGTAVLNQTAEGVKLQVEVSGLAPGKHGFHFHEFGKCVSPDFKTAGEHFNPEAKKHGFHNPQGYHAGDMPNLDVGSDGKGKAEFINRKVTLEKDKANSLLKPGGTALMIHEAADDYKTDPAGNAGARVACGVIM
jgi:Cu-Zn family superoxide dismutase